MTRERFEELLDWIKEGNSLIVKGRKVSDVARLVNVLHQKLNLDGIIPPKEFITLYELTKLLKKNPFEGKLQAYAVFIPDLTHVPKEIREEFQAWIDHRILRGLPVVIGTTLDTEEYGLERSLFSYFDASLLVESARVIPILDDLDAEPKEFVGYDEKELPEGGVDDLFDFLSDDKNQKEEKTDA